MSEPSLASELYLRLKQAWGGKPNGKRKRGIKREQPAASVPFGQGREPMSAAETLGIVSEKYGWEEVLSQAELIAGWPTIVGSDIASNTSVESFADGDLRVRCSSTAWATQLNLMSSNILSRLLTEHPRAEVQKITFFGPNAPSWKKGLKSVPGRGPRDTYG